MKKVAILYPLNNNSLDRYVKAVEKQGFTPVLVTNKDDEYKLKYQNLTIDGSLENYQQIANYLAELKDVVAVIAGGEFSVELTDLVARSLGLKQSMSKSAKILRNKYLMRDVFSKAGVNQPIVYALATNLDDLCEKAVKIKSYPVICKPVDMAGSWFVSINYSSSDIIKNASPIFFYKTAKATGLKFECQCLIESYFDGDEYSAEVIVSNGKMKHYIVNNKIISDLPHFNEVGHICGVTLSEPVISLLEENITAVIQSSGVQNSVMHVEFRVNEKEKINIIEVGCRIAGDRISDLVEIKYGLNLEEIMVRLKTEDSTEFVVTDNGLVTGIRFLFDNSDNLPEGFTTYQKQIDEKERSDSSLERTHISKRRGFEIFTTSLPQIPDSLFIKS